ncbi:MAG: transporter [Bacteroidetes bacterium]|nr:transporter [Bacteroidota bacterium]MBS1633509.1 transporter [Bacteroidota bacterium]
MKIFNIKVFPFLLLFTSHISFAQVENINTDRPDQSDGVYTVPKNKFQIENGVTISKNTFLNNFMLRYGLFHSTEIRLLSDAGKEDEAKGLKPFSISLKQRIIRQHNLLPAITFVGYMTFEQLAGKAFRSNRIPFRMELAFENELTDKFVLDYNVGTSEQFKALNLTMNLGFAPSDKISTFIEYFSTIKRSAPEHNMDAGIVFTLKPQLEFDIACGGSLSGPGVDFFTTFGVSWFFK